MPVNHMNIHITELVLKRSLLLDLLIAAL